MRLKLLLLIPALAPLLFAPLAESADTASGVKDNQKSPSSMHTPTNVTPAEAESLIQSQKDLVIIDVRTQEEFAEGHIAGAQNVNFNSPTFAEKMQAFSGKKVLVHCASGGRSTRALAVLAEMPFEKVYHLNKGFNAWVESGKPVSTKP
jgi:rhodanese-related sulfurtransferase